MVLIPKPPVHTGTIICLARSCLSWALLTASNLFLIATDAAGSDHGNRGPGGADMDGYGFNDGEWNGMPHFVVYLDLGMCKLSDQ